LPFWLYKFVTVGTNYLSVYLFSTDSEEIVQCKTVP